MLAIASVLTATAQQLMVRVVDGRADTVKIWQVDEIYFIPDTVKTLTEARDTVDLGLSVRWADRNMGAQRATDRGLLIGWGDTTLTNYSTKLQYFPIERPQEDISGSQNYDVASKKWDSEWRMPSEAELKELIDNCQWTWKENGDSVGYLGTSKVAGYETSSIFLPATGFRRGTQTAAEGAIGAYWSGTLSTDNTKARAMHFGKTGALSLADSLRYLGLAIRPVTGLLKVPTRIEKIEVTNVGTQTATVVATLSGDLDDIDPLIVVSYGKDAASLSYAETADDSHVVKSEKAATVTINVSGMSYNTKYYLKVYVKKSEGEPLVSQVAEITTLAKFPVAKAIDLGLPSGTKWASCNMGSESPLDVSSIEKAYFEWGEPTGDYHDHLLSNILYRQTGDDSKKANIAGTEYDIATVQWGQGWQLPTAEQFRELMNYTNVSNPSTFTVDGKTYNAYKFTSKTNSENFIYLPEAGLINDQNKAMQVQNGCYYWTAESEGAGSGYYVNPVKGSVEVDVAPYTFLMSVRPVYVGDGIVTPDEEDINDGRRKLTDAGRAAEAVDLGLSVKWATYNVGSTAPAVVGDYIAWADTTARADYSIANNIHGSLYNSTTGTWDYSDLELNGTDLPMKWDAANANWGGAWRMPTLQEWTELMDNDNCTWTQEGNGYRVTSKKTGYTGKSIFLPASGFKAAAGQGATDMLQQSYCKYWSSTLDGYYLRKGQYAYHFETNGNAQPLNTVGINREYGMQIRPVMSK